MWWPRAATRPLTGRNPWPTEPHPWGKTTTQVSVCDGHRSQSGRYIGRNNPLTNTKCSKYKSYNIFIANIPDVLLKVSKFSLKVKYVIYLSFYHVLYQLVTGRAFPPGAYIVTYEARDAANNAAFCSFKIYVMCKYKRSSLSYDMPF